jgi:hypothetical protein
MISYYLQHQQRDQTNSLGNKMRFVEERIMNEMSSGSNQQSKNETNVQENTPQNNEKPLEFDDGKHESYLSDRVTAFARWQGKVSTSILSEFVAKVGNTSNAIFDKHFQRL